MDDHHRHQDEAAPFALLADYAQLARAYHEALARGDAVRWATVAFEDACQKLLAALATTRSAYAARIARAVLAAHYPTSDRGNPYFDLEVFSGLGEERRPEPEAVRMRLVWIHAMPPGRQ